MIMLYVYSVYSVAKGVSAGYTTEYEGCFVNHLISFWLNLYSFLANRYKLVWFYVHESTQTHAQFCQKMKAVTSN